ncbi:MAG: GBS Bsp-like repeat-containing protein [Lachnospiraceae bacterium]|nr:GBS Bsp-like repeat-containing protein [Lachnospiraceae bacterium]
MNERSRKMRNFSKRNSGGDGSESSENKVLRVLNIAATVLVVLLGTLAMLLYRSANWAMSTWNALSMEEIAYQMKTSMEGAGEMVGLYIRQCVIITVVVLVLLIAVFILLRKKRRLTHILQIAVAVVSVIVIVLTFRKFDTEVGVTDYLSNQETYSSFIDDNYVDPNDVSLTFPEEKRNLIYIFLESMENTYSDEANGGAFSENVIPELTQLSLENENFSGTEGGLNGGIPLKGTTWTIGAMFGQTSGLPLNLPIDKNAMSTQDEFFPGATTLGNILADNGYKQMLLIGSDAAFGGRDLYFQGHGDYEIRDYYWAIDQGKIAEDYYVWWGYEDNRLFENAKEALTEMGSGSEPFNFTMLTVDTHFEDGYLCEDCPDTYDTQYSNVMACSSSKVNELISWIKEQSWYENTTIVISGDHLTMDTDYCDDVPEEYQRTVYTTIINSPTQRETDDRRTICTFDNFPTTLAALGVEIEGDRLGLGTNLYSSEATLLERYTKTEANEGLQQQSELMDNLLAGINTKLATCAASEYDPVTKTISVTVSDIEYEKPLRDLYLAVWCRGDQSDLHWYTMDVDADGNYSYQIPMTDFAINAKCYIDAYADTDDPSLTKINLGRCIVDVEDPEFESAEEETIVTEPSGTIIVEGYDSDTNQINVYTIDPEAPNGIMGIRCAVWSKEDQSDLHWYGASEVDDGIYLMQIRGSDFDMSSAELQIHVYAIDYQGESVLIGNNIGDFTEEQ